MSNQKQDEKTGFPEQVQKLKKWITENKRIAIVIAVVIAAVIVLLCVLLALRNKSGVQNPGDTEVSDDVYQEMDYYEESGYPVNVRQDGADLLVTLDGSATPDLHWDIQCTPEDRATMQTEIDEREGRMTFRLIPEASGYVDVNCVRVREMGDTVYPVVEIDLNVIIGTEINGGLAAALSDITQNSQKAGAEDTDMPYYIEGNIIYFPNGGDWVVNAEYPDPSCEQYYTIVRTQNEAGEDYCMVTINSYIAEGMDDQTLELASTAKLTLSSESLGITRQLELYQEDKGTEMLRIVEEAE